MRSTVLGEIPCFERLVSDTQGNSDSLSMLQLRFKDEIQRQRGLRFFPHSFSIISEKMDSVCAHEEQEKRFSDFFSTIAQQESFNGSSLNPVFDLFDLHAQFSLLEMEEIFPEIQLLDLGIGYEATPGERSKERFQSAEAETRKCKGALHALLYFCQNKGEHFSKLEVLGGQALRGCFEKSLKDTNGEIDPEKMKTMALFLVLQSLGKSEAIKELIRLEKGSCPNERDTVLAAMFQDPDLLKSVFPSLQHILPENRAKIAISFCMGDLLQHGQLLESSVENLKKTTDIVKNPEIDRILGQFACADKERLIREAFPLQVAKDLLSLSGTDKAFVAFIPAIFRHLDQMAAALDQHVDPKVVMRGTLEVNVPKEERKNFERLQKALIKLLETEDGVYELTAALCAGIRASGNDQKIEKIADFFEQMESSFIEEHKVDLKDFFQAIIARMTKDAQEIRGAGLLDAKYYYLPTFFQDLLLYNISAKGFSQALLCLACLHQEIREIARNSALHSFTLNIGQVTRLFHRVARDNTFGEQVELGGVIRFIPNDQSIEAAYQEIKEDPKFLIEQEGAAHEFVFTDAPEGFLL